MIRFAAALVLGLSVLVLDGSAAQAQPIGAAGAAASPAAGGASEAPVEVPMVDAAAQVMAPAQYGVGMRGRWISVPSWLLDLFTRENVPLSSYGVGLEFFRRGKSFDLLMGLTYQAMSPADGNWLGKNNPSAVDTDFLQFRGLGLVGLDAAFILHTDFNEFFGIHYGGGIGVGVVTGRLLRTSAGSQGCVNDPGNEAACHPVVEGCSRGPCTEAQLKGTEGGIDTPGSPSRFEERQVPAIIPIVNAVAGLDFRIPGLSGLEAKIEAGFYAINFFVGAGVAYRL